MKRIKIWSTRIADKKFREYILNRDKVCQKCGRSRDVILDVSHYWSRNRSSVRYNPANAIIHCRGCHFLMESEKQGLFRDYMLILLGVKKYQALEKLAHDSIPRREAIKKLMRLLSA